MFNSDLFRDLGMQLENIGDVINESRSECIGGKLKNAEARNTYKSSYKLEHKNCHYS